MSRKGATSYNTIRTGGAPAHRGTWQKSVYGREGLANYDDQTDIGQGITAHGSGRGRSEAYSALQDHINNFFNQGAVPRQDIGHGREYYQESLPESTWGANIEFRSIQIMMIDARVMTLIRTLAPFIHDEQITHIQTIDMVFNSHILEQQPETSYSGQVSHTRSGRQMVTDVAGKAIELDKQLVKTAYGRWLWMCKHLQLANACTAKFAKRFYEVLQVTGQQNRMFFNPAKENRPELTLTNFVQECEPFLATFGMAHKHPDVVSALHRIYDPYFQDRQTSFDTIVMSDKTLAKINETKNLRTAMHDRQVLGLRGFVIERNVGMSSTRHSSGVTIHAVPSEKVKELKKPIGDPIHQCAITEAALFEPTHDRLRLYDYTKKNQEVLYKYDLLAAANETHGQLEAPGTAYKVVNSRRDMCDMYKIDEKHGGINMLLGKVDKKVYRTFGTLVTPSRHTAESLTAANLHSLVTEINEDTIKHSIVVVESYDQAAKKHIRTYAQLGLLGTMYKTFMDANRPADGNHNQFYEHAFGAHEWRSKSIEFKQLLDDVVQFINRYCQTAGSTEDSSLRRYAFVKLLKKIANGDQDPKLHRVDDYFIQYATDPHSRSILNRVAAGDRHMLSFVLNIAGDHTVSARYAQDAHQAIDRPNGITIKDADDGVVGEQDLRTLFGSDEVFGMLVTEASKGRWEAILQAIASLTLLSPTTMTHMHQDRIFNPVQLQAIRTVRFYTRPVYILASKAGIMNTIIGATDFSLGFDSHRGRIRGDFRIRYEIVCHKPELIITVNGFDVCGLVGGYGTSIRRTANSKDGDIIVAAIPPWQRNIKGFSVTTTHGTLNPSPPFKVNSCNDIFPSSDGKKHYHRAGSQFFDRYHNQSTTANSDIMFNLNRGVKEGTNKNDPAFIFIAATEEFDEASQKWIMRDGNGHLAGLMRGPQFNAFISGMASMHSEPSRVQLVNG